MIKKYIVLIFIISAIKTYSQQDPNYTQYMYNMSVVNPAYAGSKDAISIGVLHRQQWVGVDGAPNTSTLFAHTPLGKNVGGGISVISDKIGPVEENNIYGDFSYTINITDKSKLAFGLKFGATFHKIGLRSDVLPTLPNLNDDAFKENTNTTNINYGAGVFYYTDNYYVAFSIPNLNKSVHLDFNGNNYGSEVQHYFLTAGYVFQLSDKLKFKPFTLLKSAINAPLSFDISTNFLYKEKFEIGATYRNEDSFGGIVNFAITPSLRIGYAYDHIISDLKVSTTASHEFLLLFDLNLYKKVSKSQRYF